MISIINPGLRGPTDSFDALRFETAPNRPPVPPWESASGQFGLTITLLWLAAATGRCTVIKEHLTLWLINLINCTKECNRGKHEAPPGDTDL